ncbi:MAG: CHAT domain-containing protein [Myxococcaceae bacterium]|nr:CHAT domain-containing protein [Myxococcaceae bacterium]
MGSTPSEGPAPSTESDTWASLEAEPYERVLEFARAHNAEDPYAFHFEEQDYQLRTEGGARRSAPFPWNQRLLADLQALFQEPPDAEAARRLGEQMRRFLDALDWGGHEDAFEPRHGAGAPLRLVLRSAAAELYALPWELVTLKDSGLHLAELPGCTLRYEWPRERANLPLAAAHQGGRVLFAWSAAGGLVPAEEHLEALRQACQAGELPFDARRDVLSRVSLSSLEERLRSAREPVSALHVLCHGAPLAAGRGQLYGLAWNGAGDGSEVEVVDGGALAAVLAPYSSTLRLVVLCACQGGDSGALASHLGSIAQALHRAGIEAVLASRLPLSARGSVVLTETLYRKLLVDSCSLEKALDAARRKLRMTSTRFDWASLQLYAHRRKRADLRPVVLRPYRGLLAFEPQHRRFFFGRRRLEAALLERVRQAAAAERPRLQVVAGASGTGKSSVVMAGLLPLLPPEEWDWLVVRPGELVRAGVRGPVVHSVALQELRQRLRQLEPSEPLPAIESASLADLVDEARRLRQARPERKLLLVLDQLEEVFTQLQPEERQALMRGIWALTRAPELGCIVIATLRVDHFERCGEVLLDERTRLDAVVYAEEHRLFAAQMGPEELAEAIEQPARKVGLELEPWLVERLCKDVGQEPGALPLLEHALDLLWQKRTDRWLRHHAYEEMGGVAGALSQTAEQLYAALSKEERRQTRRLLVRLVAMRDMGGPRAQRRVWVEELRPAEEARRRAFDAALEKLVSRRLLVKGSSGNGDWAEQGAWIQLAHETLLRRWMRLERWIEEDWDREQQLRELDRWAEDWEAHLNREDGGTSYLLSGDRLGYAKSLRARIGDELSARSRRLIEESQSLEERRQEQERARQEKEKETLRALSELLQQEQALRRMAQSTTRILLAEQVRQQDPTKGLLLLREVDPAGRNQMWMSAAMDALQQPVARAVLRGHGVPLRMAAFSPDGKRVATSAQSGPARVWSVEGALLATLEGHTGSVNTIAFSPDGQRLATASADDTARVWSADGALLATLAGHTRSVNVVAFSPDGRRLATASADNTARVWSVDGALLATLAGHTSSVNAVAFSPDGQQLATASTDRTARVWSVEGALLATLAGHDDSVRSATFSPDGQRLVTVSIDRTARVWSVKGALLATLAGHSDLVVSATFSPDGHHVATASWDRTARIWSAEGRLLVTLGGHSHWVLSAAFSPDGERVVTASKDRTARMWSASGTLLATLAGHGGAVCSASFSPDGQHVVTASDDQTARVWSVEGTLSTPLKGHHGAVRSVAFSPDGQHVVTASDDQTARVWSAAGHELARLEGHGDSSVSATFSPDGRRVVTAGSDGKTRIWSVEGALLATLAGHRGWVLSAAFSPDGQRVVTASEDGTARVWSAEGTLLATLKGHGEHVVSAAFSSGGQQLVTASWDKTARLWSAQGQLLATLEGHSERVVSAAFGPSGQRVVTASWDKTARLWSARGQLLAQLEGHEDGLVSAAFSPDGQRVVTASVDETARVWSAEGTLLATLRGHVNKLLGATFSPDGQRVVTASADGTARVWNVEGKHLATLRGHRGKVLGAVFSPDGEQVATASEDRTARVWPLSARLLMARLEGATNDCLGDEDRHLYLDAPPERPRAGLKHLEEQDLRSRAAQSPEEKSCFSAACPMTRQTEVNPGFGSPACESQAHATEVNTDANLWRTQTTARLPRRKMDHDLFEADLNVLPMSSISIESMSTSHAKLLRCSRFLQPPAPTPQQHGRSQTSQGPHHRAAEK